jgi:hypothetical protein
MPMTEQERADYESAAVALEKHLLFSEITSVAVIHLARKAFDSADAKPEYKGVRRTGHVINAIDRRAARLLRGCLLEGEPLK